MAYKHLFGPIISRRLGLSLGVDLVPYKVCSLDCVYCEVGTTTDLLVERKEFIKPEDIIVELSHFLQRQAKIDFITFSGAGEPTLNICLEEIISEIKRLWPQYRLALITNSTMLQDEKLCKALLNCDLILPSLDAVSDKVFQQINRPHPTLKPQTIIQSLSDFRKIFANQIWLEIFFIEGINVS
ncbi:MAG: radical SAM protein [Candidatus Cloacimonetes bacterium]|nr:radical SAM protein [Candidatus Cloacimonadota bacterium]